MEELPVEVAQRMLRLLGPRDLSRMGMVSRAWRALAADEWVWERVHRRTFGGPRTTRVSLARDKKKQRQAARKKMADVRARRLLPIPMTTTTAGGSRGGSGGGGGNGGDATATAMMTSAGVEDREDKKRAKESENRGCDGDGQTRDECATTPEQATEWTREQSQDKGAGEEEGDEGEEEQDEAGGGGAGKKNAREELTWRQSCINLEMHVSRYAFTGYLGRQNEDLLRWICAHGHHRLLAQLLRSTTEMEDKGSCAMP